MKKTKDFDRLYSKKNGESGSFFWGILTAVLSGGQADFCILISGNGVTVQAGES
ncbi:MAG: hypothetical protein SO231_17635 [Phocaeicola vulgatus]|nr:hypothetical protein [Phocaeicola vulgatus]